jgi:hypothetical protein
LSTSTANEGVADDLVDINAVSDLTCLFENWDQTRASRLRRAHGKGSFAT